MLLTLHQETMMERIASVSTIACANWSVVHRLTLSVGATSAQARILTFILLTNSVWRTVCIYRTLWSAPFVRIPEISRGTHTRTSVITFCTDSIASARRRSTRCRSLRRYHVVLHVTIYERISNVSLRTYTVRSVTDNAAFCHGTACSCTRITALVVYTS